MEGLLCIDEQKCCCVLASQGARSNEGNEPDVPLDGVGAAPGVASTRDTPPLLSPDTNYGFDGLWPRRPGHARLLHTGSFPALRFARDHALALISGGTAPVDAVAKCAADHHVDATSLALAVGRVLGASQLKSHEKDDMK